MFALIAKNFGLLFTPQLMTNGITVVIYHRKMKRKDSKDLVLSDEQLVYLRDEFVRLCIIDADLQSLVALPTAVDQNEWLATNSK